jgi:hypothetical protein
MFESFKKLVTRNNLALFAVIALIVVIVVIYKMKIERFDDGDTTVLEKYYYLPKCPYCVAFSNEWSKFQAAADPSLITATPVDASTANGSKESSDAGVSGYPTIKITKNGNTVDYTGERTAEAINDYIANL